MKIIVFFTNIIITLVFILFKLLKYVKNPQIKPKEEIINDDFFKELVEPVTYYGKLKGKNIRNMIIQDFANYANIDRYFIKNLIKFTDIMHNAALVIDDIQDNSFMRRNNPCAHIKYGIPYSIAASYSQVFNSLFDMTDDNNYPVIPEELGVYCEKVRNDDKKYKNFDDNTIRLLKNNELLKVTIENIYKAHIGQEMEVYWTFKKIIPTIEEYLVMVDYKTCVIFKNIIDSVNVYSKMNKVIYDNHQTIFKNFGTFFQIRDDYINITSPDFWKEKGFCEDFDEKKYSYIVICYWNTTEEKEREKFLELFHKNNLTFDEKIELLKMINKTNILDKVYDELVEYKKELEKYSFFSSVWDKLPFYKFDIENCYKL